jgi:DNA mismatch repair protein MutS2
VLNEARAQAQAELDELEADIDRTRRQLAGFSAGGHAPSGASTHQQMLAEAQQVLAQRRKAAEPAPASVEAQVLPSQRLAPLAAGDTVWIPSLQASGQIVAIAPADQDAEVQIGSFRMRLPLGRLERRDVSQATPVGITKPKRLPTPEQTSGAAPLPHVGLELDIRGANVEEMLPRLEKYLDDAYLGMMPWVRIIHGKGTGVLRTAVRKELSKHPLVKSFREGEAATG